MGNKYRRLIYAWVVFIFSEVVAASIIYCLYRFHIDGEQGWIQNKPLYQTLAVGMPINLIIINGHGMVIFRLLPGIKTRIIKYIHVLIHSIVIGLFIYLCHVIYIFKEPAEHPLLWDFHAVKAYLTMGSYILQWSLACAVYMFLNQKRRKLFAAWHNFFGICILQLSIVTSCCILQWEEHHLILLRTTSLHGAVASALMVIYGLIINVLVLNPYLEWPLVGPI